MALVVPDDYLNVHFGYAATGDDQLAYTSVGIVMTGGQDLAEALAIAQEASDAWQLSFKAVTSPDWAMTGSRVTVGGATTPYLSFDLTGTTTGEGFASSLPNNCAVLISKLTATPGRPGRGRMYVPGLDANSTFVSGRMETTARSDWQDAIEEWAGLVLLVAGVQNLCLFHDELSPISTPSEIVGFVVQPQIATQRRRMRP